MIVDIEVVLEDLNAKLPTKGSEASAAYDLYSCHDIKIPSDTFRVVSTGISMDLKGMGGIISHRSGHNSKHGLQAYGLVDPDYRGIVKVTLFNNSPWPYRVAKGERVAQLMPVFLPASRIAYRMTLEPTDRGDAGHGSTGTD